MNKKNQVKSFSSPGSRHNLATPSTECSPKALTTKQLQSKEQDIKVEVLSPGCTEHQKNTIPWMYSNHYSLGVQKEEKINIQIFNVNKDLTNKNISIKNNQLHNITIKFSGEKGESFSDWIRQFKMLLKLNTGYDETNLQWYAASHLIGEAGRYFDELKEQPETWTQFIEIMEKRYGTPAFDKPTILRRVLIRRQKINEPTKKFCEEVYKMAEEASMEESLAIQTIISNLLPDNKKLYRLHIKDDISYKNLLAIIDIIECEDSYNEEENDYDRNPKRDANEYEDIVEKIEKLSLLVNRNTTQNDKFLHRTPICQNCQRKGHTSHECYKKKKYTEYRRNPSIDYEQGFKNKLNEIQRLLEKKIEGKISEFRNQIKTPTRECLKFFDAIPAHYNAYTTLRKNELFLNEILKSLKNNHNEFKINYLSKQEEDYDIITCVLNINGKEIFSVLDTGAAFTVISSEAAKEIDMPININDNNFHLTLANDSTVPSNGSIQNLPIIINDNTFPCDAVVLNNAAHNLLIGTNWLTKHRVIIDLNSKFLRIPTHNDNEFLIPINCFKIKNKNTKTIKNKPKKLICYSNSKTTLNTKQSQRIDITMKIENAEAIPENSVIFIKDSLIQDIQVARGIYDISNVPNFILLANTSNNNKTIEKGQKVAEVELMEHCSMMQVISEPCNFSIDKILELYKGPIDRKNEFETMLKELSIEKFNTKPINVYHEIHVEENSKPVGST